MKRYKRYIFITISVLTLIFMGFKILEYIEFKKTNLLNSYFKLQSLSLSEKLSIEILRKKESTKNIAISIANSDGLMQKIMDNNIPKNYFKPLIKKLKSNNAYKNIWIQVINANGITIYKSWTNVENNISEKNDKKLYKMPIFHEVKSSITVDEFDLSFKTTAPIFKNNVFLGAVELISRFNSISEKLSDDGIGSVVIALKNSSKQLKKPFSKHYIGKYYVANINAPKKLREYLKNNKIENYLSNSYKIENNYLVVSYPIKNSDLKIIGYYIMFQKLNSLQNRELNLFLFKLLLIIVIVILLSIIIITMIFLNINKKQKEHYKNIIDSSTNIMFLHNLSNITAANKAFFKLFNIYSNLEDFLHKHKCISDFFSKEDGYLQKRIDNEGWIIYLIKNQDKEHKAKIIFLEEVYYFLVSASLIDQDSNQYCIVLTDITKQEIYKKELESLTITDTLTKIKNRRYFQTKLDEEISSCKRYGYPLSIIMADIDHFKKINDKFGHLVGDKVLKEYTNVISSLLRKDDTFCRIGGEEFVIILPHINLDDAIKIAEKLRVRVQFRKEIVPITMSFGVTEYIQNEKIATLYSRVDRALYDAKRRGRNRVISTKS